MAKLTDDILRWNLEINGDSAMKALTDLEQTTYNLRRANEQLRLELLKLEAAGKKNTDEYKSLAAQIKSNNSTIDINRAKMATMRNEIGVNALSARQLKDELKRLKLQLDNTTPNTQAWKELSNQYNTVKNRLGEVNVGQNKSNALFGAFKSLIPGLGIASVATGLLALGKEIVNTVMHIEMFDRKVKLTFGETLPMMTAAAAENANQMELTKRKYLETTASTANFMLQMGFSREKAAALSTQVIYLAGALKEWNGDVMETDQVNELLTKGILGQTRGLKELGITVDTTSREYKKSVEALMENEKVTREQAEALTMLAQIQERSKLATAAYAQDMDSLKNKVESVTTWWKQLKENVAGWFLIPTEEKIRREQSELNILAGSIMSVNDNEALRKNLIKEMQLKYPDFLKYLDAENISNEQLLTALKGVNIEYDKKIQLSYLEGKLTDKLKEGQTMYAEREEKLKAINAVYIKYVENADLSLSLEQKLQAIRESTSNGKVLGGINAWYKGYVDLSAQLNKNAEEYNEIQKEKTETSTSVEKDKLKINDFYEAQKAGIIKGETEVRDLTTEETIKLAELRRQLAEKEKVEYSPEFYEAQKLGIIKEGVEVRKLTQDEMDKLDELRKKEADKLADQKLKEAENYKKELEKQKEYREGVLNAAKSLVDQEKVAYDKRLKDAGLFGKDRSKLTADELKALEILEKQYAENVKKIQEKEAEPILSIINAHKTLTEQEEMAYEKRLRDYKLFGKDKATMTADELKAFEILEKEHQENIAKINDKAFSDDITKQKELFDQATIVRQTQFNNEIIALGDDEDAKAVLKTKFQKEELEKQKQFLEEQLKQFQDKLATGEIEGLDIENSMLTDEQKEALKVKIDELKLKLSELGIEVAGIKPDPKKDLFGMTPDDWKDLWKNLLEIISIASEISSAWASINQIKANHDQKDLQQFEKDSNTRKKTLEKELKAKSITQEEYTEKIAAIDAAVEARKKKAAYDAAKRAKGQAYFDTFLNTAAASIKMLVDPGGLLGWILAASAAIMGGLKMAAIASEPLPEMKEGGYTDVIGESDKKKYHAKLAGKQKGLITEPSILVAEDKPEYVVPGDLLEKNKTVRRYVEEIEVMRVGKQFAGGGYITPPLRMDGGQGGDTAGYIIPSNARGDKDVERIIYLIDKQRENTGLSPEFIEKVYDNWQRNMDIITAGEKKLISTRADNIEIEKKLMVQREETSRLQAASVPQTIRLTAPQIIEPINFKGISQYQHPPVQKETTTITNNYPAPEANDYAELNDTVKRLNAFLDRLDKNGVEVPWTKIKEKFDQYDKIQKEVNT
jgi:hypothetical protein